MSAREDVSRTLEALTPFVVPVAVAISAPTVVGPIVTGIMAAVVALLRDGRDPEEVRALLEELRMRPPGRVDLEAIEARVKARLEAEEEETKP